MAPARPYLDHLTASDDLVTPYQQIRAGFVALALEKNRKATPAVEQARALQATASRASTPADLANVTGITPALLAAAGLSDKAVKHLTDNDKAEAIQQLVKNFLEPAGKDFVEELVYRFLLTRGDALGGSMRNLAGMLAQRKLTRTVIATLSLAASPYRWFHPATKTWLLATDQEPPADLDIRGLSWSNAHGGRTVLYNLTIPLVRKNVDFSLFDATPDQLTPASRKQPELYLALGELKGGIDPAGADEHWKTARTALSRIRTAFSAHGNSPFTFAVLAAIAKSMAHEIWDDLEQSVLTNAANLTDPKQVTSLCRWLIDL